MPRNPPQPPRKTPPTLQDIATAADLSTAAVSLALRGRAGVSAETRERVHALAQEMGYRPSPGLAALVARRVHHSRRSETPAAIISSGEVASGVARDGMLHDLREHALALGYRPKLFTVKDPSQYPALLRQLYHTGTMGIILHRAIWEPGCGGDGWENFSLTHCQPLHDRPPIHTVRSAVYRKTVEIARRMEALGYQRVAQVVMVHDQLLEHPDDSSRMASALEGYYRHKRKWPQPLQLLFTEPFEQQVEKIYQYQVSSRCDGIVVPTAGIAQWLLESERQDPATRPGIAAALISEEAGGISGMVNNGRQLADQAALLLDQQIRNNRKGFPEFPVDVVVPTTWWDGASLPPLVTA